MARPGRRFQNFFGNFIEILPVIEPPSDIYSAGFIPDFHIIYGIKKGGKSKLFYAAGPIVVEKADYATAGEGADLAGYLIGRFGTQSPTNRQKKPRSNQYINLILQPQTDYRQKLFVKQGDYHLGEGSDCTLGNGSTLTLYSDGRYHWLGHVSSTHGNDVWRTEFDFYDSNRNLIYTSPLSYLGTYWFFEYHMDDSDHWYDWGLDYTYPGSLFDIIAYVNMHETNC
jgi:hypothetical protein